MDSKKVHLLQRGRNPADLKLLHGMECLEEHQPHSTELAATRSVSSAAMDHHLHADVVDGTMDADRVVEIVPSLCDGYLPLRECSVS